MPYRITDPTSGLIRTTGLVSGNSDYTALIQFQFLANGAGAQYRTVFAQINDPGIPAYTNDTGIFSNNTGANPQNYYVDTSINGVVQPTTPTTLTANQVYWMVYVRKGNAVRHYFLNGATNVPTLIGTVNNDASAFLPTQLIIGNDGGSLTNVEFAYFRDWSAALSLNEIFVEFCSSKAARTLNLISDCPFESNLNDISGLGNHFADQGVAGTFTTAAPAPNFTIGALPFSQVVTQATFNIANLVWFKYTNDRTRAFGNYTNSGGTFTPRVSFFRADGISIIKQFAGGSSGEFRIIGPGDYYIKIVRSAGGASNFDFTAQFDKLPVYPDFSIPSDALLVNDDSAGFAGSVADITGTKLGFIISIPGGELGSALGNGITLWYDSFGYDKKLKLLSKTMSLITEADTTPSLGSSTNPCCICNNASGQDFYILRVVDGKIWKMSSAGTLTDTGKTLPNTNDVTAIGINSNASILYYARGSVDNIIRRWDMINNVALSNLYVIPGLTSGYIAQSAINNNNGEILVLQDGTIVTWFENFLASNQNSLLHLNPDGTLINQVDIPTGNYQYIDHINYTQNSGLINIWFFKDTGASNGKFATLALLTGTLQSSFITDLFSAYGNLVSSDPVIFGPSASCTMLTYLYLNQGGIYKIVKDKRQDTLWLDVGAKTTIDVKIPDPQFKTALLGD